MLLAAAFCCFASGWALGTAMASKPELTRTKGYATFTNKFHIYVEHRVQQSVYTGQCRTRTSTRTQSQSQSLFLFLSRPNINVKLPVQGCWVLGVFGCLCVGAVGKANIQRVWQRIREWVLTITDRTQKWTREAIKSNRKWTDCILILNYWYFPKRIYKNYIIWIYDIRYLSLPGITVIWHKEILNFIKIGRSTKGLCEWKYWVLRIYDTWYSPRLEF